MSNSTSTQEASLTARPIVGLELLGYGYNIFTSNFCDVTQATELFFPSLKCNNSTPTQTLPEFTDLFQIPTIVRCLKDQSSGQDYTIWGETSEKFTSQLTVKAGCSGSYGAFSASIDTSFDKSSSSYVDSIYCEHGHVFAGFSLQLPHSMSDLRKNLDSNIKKELLNQTPEYIIQNYGTHVITSVVIGSKCRMRQKSVRSEIKDATEWSEAVSAQYGSVSANENVLSKYTSDISKFLMETVIETLGGDNRRIANPDDYKQWQATAYTNPAIIDLTGTVPIWQLLDPNNAEELQKRKALKEAIQLYAMRFQIGVLYAITQQFNTMNSGLAWIPQGGSYGRDNVWIDGVSYSQEYAKGYSRSILWQSTGMEGLMQGVPDGLVVYGGRQLQSNDTSTAPFVEISSWGVRKHPATGQDLEETTPAYFFNGDDMSRITFFVGPLTEAVKGAFVIAGGSTICNGQETTWGAEAKDGRQSVLAGDAISYRGDFGPSQIYLVVEDACQSLPEAPGD